MSLNGSGVYVVNSSGQPVVAGTLITAAVFNAFTADIASALSTAIFKDGQQTVTANIPMNSKKFTGLANGSARTDSANLANIQDGTGVYVGTVGGTADAITLTASPAITAYAAGQTFRFIASGANTGAVTVDVNGVGAKAITKNGTTALAAGDIPASAMVQITYDGTQFVLGTLGAATIPSGATLKSTLTTKGDIYVATGSATPVRQGVGADGTALVALAALTNGIYYQPGVISPVAMIGGHITVTMASSAVTLAVKTTAGNDPSSTEPVWVQFRSATLTDPIPVWRQITAATSLVVSSGSTLGTVSGQASRIYVGAIDNAGTVELCAWNPLDGVNLFLPQETVLQSTTAEGGAGAADSAHVVYATAARTSKALRVLGYFESTQTTAGTWDTAASIVQMMGPGVLRTGDKVQSMRTQTGAVATGTTTVPYDDTIPQNTEGDEYMTRAIVPTSAINLLAIESQGMFINTGNGAHLVMFLCQDSTADALAAMARLLANSTTNQTDGTVALSHTLLAGTTSSTTFKIRAGNSVAGTTTFNGSGGARRYGGVAASFLSVTEIFQ